MKLTELEPHLLKIIDEHRWKRVEEINDADGILFLCPVCYAINNGPVGTHSVLCWNPSVPQTVKPTPGRWNLIGTSLNDLSLVAGSSSILLTGDGCKAHFFIKNGEIVNA